MDKFAQILCSIWALFKFTFMKLDAQIHSVQSMIKLI